MEVGQGYSSMGMKQVVLKLEKNVEKRGGTLIGKILTSKNLNIPTVISLIKKGWHLEDELEIHDLDRSQLTFLFRFSDVKDYGRILNGRPWSVQGNLINLQVWEEYMVPKDVRFGETPFWVQFHGLPLEAFDNANAKTLGDVVGEAVMYDKPKVEGRLGRGFIRVRCLIRLNDPLVPGFWVPREEREPAWVNVKYERLQDFCFKCDCIGHIDRGCRVVNERKVGDDGAPVFGSWLGATGLRTFDEVVEICKNGWCEARFLARNSSDCKYRWSWTPEMAKRENIRSESVCQNIVRFGQDSMTLSEIDLNQRRSAEGNLIEEMSTLAGQNALITNEASSPRDTSFDRSKSLCKGEVVGGKSSGGPSELPGQDSGPVSGLDTSPLSSGIESGCKVDFLLDASPIRLHIQPHNGLSPISSMAFSLQSINLKRPCDDELGSATIKKQRKLIFDAEEMPYTPKPFVLQVQRGRRRSFRSVKSFLRSKSDVKQPVCPIGASDVGEVDFPASWLEGNGDINDISESSYTHNVGGWTGPTTGAP